MFTWIKKLNKSFDDAVDGFVAKAKEAKKEKRKRDSAWLTDELEKIRTETDRLREQAVLTGKPIITAVQKPVKAKEPVKAKASRKRRGTKNRISINGQSFDVFGRNVQVSGNTVYVDGVEVACELEGIVKIEWEGDLASLNSDYRVDVKGDVHGDAKSKMGMKCGNVTGNADCKMSLHCGNIEGNATSSMSIHCKTVKGDAKAGMSIRGI